MSELKVASCFEFEKVLSGKSNKLFYSKSEVDKVVAEKDAKILALDAEVFKQKHHAKLFFDERNYAETKLRHHKYQRCLAKAERCKAEQTYSSFSIYITEHPKSRWANKSVLVGAWFAFWKNREQRWLELAEKFKEAK